MSAVHEIRTGELPVPGARLTYEVSGQGPLLLFADNNGGESRRRAAIVAELSEFFTVVTYDRRGFARSPLDVENEPTPFEIHADDARRLLAEVSAGPAAIVGFGLGVIVGLHLAATDPDLAHTLIAHTPHAPCVLTGADRMEHVQAFEDLANVYHTAGLAMTIVRTGEFLGIDVASQRRGAPSSKLGAEGAQQATLTLSAQSMPPERTRNFDWLYINEIPAACKYAIGVDDLTGSATRIIPGIGATTPDGFFGNRCARSLGALLGAPVVEFPGGYNPHITHPVEYAADLRRLLAE